MIKLKPNITLPVAGLSGFEPPLTEEESAVQQAVHRFAKDILRPQGRLLDKMTAEEVIAPDSPYWQVMGQAAALGLGAGSASEDPRSAIKIESIVGEELGWGDAGLAVSMGASGAPSMMAASVGKQELIELCIGKIGCWMITQPDKGTDMLQLYPEREMSLSRQGNRGNVWGRIVGDEIVINGQCSAWVSNGVIAQVALGYIGADYGNGLFDENGKPYGMAVIIPLDLPGVRKGKPLDKIGQRALPQGEIYFDNVKVPKRFAVALKDEYWGNMTSIWSWAGTFMSQVFTGVARSAFELSLAYCHERKQGGSLLINHQLTQWRLGDMLRRVEFCRAMARRSIEYATFSPMTHPNVTAMSKVTVTEEAMKVASEAFQFFGGNGTSREYPIEKIFRDARSALIEDGENYMLTARLGVLAGMLYENGWAKN